MDTHVPLPRLRSLRVPIVYAKKMFNHFEYTNSKLHCRILCSVKALCTLIPSKGSNCEQTLFFFSLFPSLSRLLYTALLIIYHDCLLPTTLLPSDCPDLNWSQDEKQAVVLFSNFKLQPGPTTTLATSFQLIYQASCFSFWSHGELCPFPLRHVTICPTFLVFVLRGKSLALILAGCSYLILLLESVSLPDR